MLYIILTFLITNLTQNQTPWNTALPNNGVNSIAALPTLFTQNFPWAIPLLTLILLLATDYVMSTKSQVDPKTTFVALSLVFVMLSYLEVAGGLTDSGYFFMFSLIALLAFGMMTLFKNEGWL